MTQTLDSRRSFLVASGSLLAAAIVLLAARVLGFGA